MGLENINALEAYDPTYRDKIRWGLADFLGGGYRARNFADRLVGSPSRLGVADAVPVVGGVMGAQEGSRTFKRGRQTGDPVTALMGLAEIGLSVIPEGGAAAAAIARPGARRAAARFARDESGALLPQLNPAQKTAQDMLDLLKAGRGREVTEEMAAAADPQYLAKNYDLPMDEASRMARADEHYPDEVFHNTTEKRARGIREFDPDKNDYRITKGTGTFTNTSRELVETYGGKGRETMALRGARDNQYSIDFKDRALIPAHAEKTIKTPAGDVNARASASVFRRVLELGPDEAARTARKMGAGSLRQKNILDPGKLTRTKKVPRGDNIVYFDPTQLRSVNARFDPRLKHLANLSAGVGGVAFALPDLIAEKKRRNLDALLAEKKRRNGT